MIRNLERALFRVTAPTLTSVAGRPSVHSSVGQEYYQRHGVLRSSVQDETYYPTRANIDRTSHIVTSPLTPVPEIPDVCLAEFLLTRMEKFGHKTLILDAMTGLSYTFTEAAALALNVAANLRKQGFRRQDILYLISANCCDFVVAELAVFILGGIVSPANPQYTKDEITYQIRDCGAKFVIADESSVNKVKEAVSSLDFVKKVIVFGTAEGCVPFSIMVETPWPDNGPLSLADARIAPADDVALLPYSSGTTGLPKGVMITHRNMISNVMQTHHGALGYPFENERVLGMLPFFHCYGNLVNMMAMANGSTIVCVNKFEPKLFYQTIQNHELTNVAIVPPIALLLANDKEARKYDLTSIKNMVCGAAPLDGDLAEKVCTVHRLNPIRQGYGMTESTACSHYTQTNSIKHGSVGFPILGMESKIVDLESGVALESGSEGEIAVRGPQVMKGYFGNPEATLDTVDQDGWLYTGDIGYVDEDGHLFVVDRKKELIKHKGFQVAPGELEALLLRHPSIADAAVIGKPDTQTGELPRAYVVRKKDVRLSSEEVQQYVSANVSSHKHLRGGVEFVDSIPKSVSGKILRRVLKTRLLEEMKESKET